MNRRPEPIALGPGIARRRVNLTTAAEHGSAGGGPYLIAAAISLVLASASLRFPSTPTYDPWAWVIWGRELIHLDLTTIGGPTWKPLPVIFTTLFAPFGSAAPDLWLVVARAGGILAVVMAFAVAYRLTRRVSLSVAGPDDDRLLSDLEPILAGVAAAIGLIVLSLYINDIALGDSEGLLLAFVLIAVMRHLDGEPVQAFVLGFAAGLDRPETWPFLLVYAAYLWRGDPRARKLIVVLLGLLLPLWFMPELIGSGALLRGVQHAVDDPGSAATTSCPMCTELVKHAWPLVINPFKVGLAVVLTVGLLPLWQLVGGDRTSSGGGLRVRAIGTVRAVFTAPSGAALAVGLFGVTLIFLEAALTEVGFSGNDRYLILAAGVIIVAGSVGWAIAMGRVATLLAQATPRPFALVAALAVAILAFVAIAPRSHSRVLSVSPTLRQLRYQAELRTNLAAAVRQAGGAKRIIACGSIETNPSFTPLAAWILRTKLITTESNSGNVLIPMRSVPGATLYPTIPAGKGYQLIAKSGVISIYASCARG